VTASEKHPTGERKKNVKQYKRRAATVTFCCDHLAVMAVAETAGALVMAPAATIQYLLVTEATISRRQCRMLKQRQFWRWCSERGGDCDNHLYLLIKQATIILR